MNVALVSMGLLLGTMGCDSFLTDVSTDPNNPAKATIQTLLVGVQGAQFAFQEGTVPMMLCEWMQACGATNGRYVEQAGRYDYGAGSNIAANGTDWALIYTGGGLIDMDTIAGMARAAGDSLYLGIDLVWKAFALGSATSLWGSIPYSQIRTSRTPALDPQLVLYDTVQAMLGHAIHLLGSGITTLAAPPDLVFSGNAAKWTGVANTLKARYWMHLADHGVPAHYGVRTTRYSLIYYYGQPLGMKGALKKPTEPEWELFDLQKDPQQMRNVYNDPAYGETVRVLTAELQRLRREVGDDR